MSLSDLTILLPFRLSYYKFKSLKLTDYNLQGERKVPVYLLEVGYNGR
jgi:hypothetical protein